MGNAIYYGNLKKGEETAMLYDYQNHAWTEDGKYVRCVHKEECECYGKLHEGEQVDPKNLLINRD